MFHAVRLYALRLIRVRPGLKIVGTVQAKHIPRFLAYSLGAGTAIGCFSLGCCSASESWMPFEKSIANSVGLKVEGEINPMVISAMLDLHNDVIRALQRLEGNPGKLVAERTEEHEGGGKITCVMQDGNVFEKACVIVSVTSDDLPIDALNVGQSRFQTGMHGPVHYSSAIITSAIHPRNPNIPSLHFSFGYFEVRDSTGIVQSWFDGSCDLTPYILHEDDVRHFHQTLKQTCDRHDKSYYHTFKKQCDKYLFIPHKQEHRGVGGILFSGLNDASQDAFAFFSDCLLAVLPSYVPIVERNSDKGYSYCDRDWQLARQGRYVEFCLVYGKGVGQAEDLMLPLNARWKYNREFQERPNERKLLEILKNPKEWV